MYSNSLFLTVIDPWAFAIIFGGIGILIFSVYNFLLAGLVYFIFWEHMPALNLKFSKLYKSSWWIGLAFIIYSIRHYAFGGAPAGSRMESWELYTLLALLPLIGIIAHTYLRYRKLQHKTE